MEHHYVLDARTAVPRFPGIGRYVANLARALPPLLAQDERLTVLCQAGAAALPAPDGAGVDVRLIAQSPFSLGQQWSVPRMLREIGAGLYHSPYYLMPYRPGVPAVLTVYDLIPLTLPGHTSLRARLLFRWTAAMALSSARAIIAISESTRADYQRRFTLQPGQIMTIPLAADPVFRPQPAEAIDALRRQYGLPDRFVLYVGSNKPHKNLAGLVKGWAALRDLGVECPLVVSGPWEERYAAPRLLAAELGLEDLIRWLGPVPTAHLPALYGASTLFVFPSLYEGFGFPVLEAMACGVPVVCSDRTSLPEVAGDAAIQVDPTVANALAAAVESVLADEARRRLMRERGIAQAARFTWSHTAAQTLALYRRLAAQPQP